MSTSLSSTNKIWSNEYSSSEQTHDDIVIFIYKLNYSYIFSLSTCEMCPIKWLLDPPRPWIRKKIFAWNIMKTKPLKLVVLINVYD